jgi:nitrite reductase (NADH) large subunit
MADQKILQPKIWEWIQVLGVAVVFMICLGLFTFPEATLFFFWRIAIPILPLVFLIAVGFWRNVCPLITLNQVPNKFNFSHELNLPKWLNEYYYVISISLLFIIVTSRKFLFNTDGTALALLILGVATIAFMLGIFFRGKSGFCNSICPVLPVERIYGQTPFLQIPNCHCPQCISCTKNCIDFNPNTSYLLDLYDKNHHHKAYRKFFVGMFPGFILAFYIIPNPPSISILEMYLNFALYSIVSAGTFFLIDSFVKVTTNKITVLYGAAALNLYYWFNSLLFGELISTPPSMAFVWAVRLFIFGLTIIWIYRTYNKELAFVDQSLDLDNTKRELHIEKI